jgi:hypothetical protein
LYIQAFMGKNRQGEYGKREGRQFPYLGGFRITQIGKGAVAFERCSNGLKSDAGPARSTRWASGWAAWEVRAALRSPGAPRCVERPISPKRHPQHAKMAHGPPPQGVPGDQIRPNSPSHPAGTWGSRQGD